MRAIYRVSFRIGTDVTTRSVSLETIAKSCIDWVFDPRRQDISKPHEFERNVLAGVDLRNIGPGSEIETVSTEYMDQELWGLRYEHPDSPDKGVRWQTELTARRNESENETHFACVLRRGAITGFIAPIRPARSRPRIVHQVLQNYGGFAGRPISASPQILKPSGIQEFLDLLFDERRMRPLVFISARNLDDKPIANGQELASWLCGLAHVVVAESRFPSLSLKNYLPTRLQCWDGAVRIYWPSFRKSDDPFRHRLWTSLKIREIEGRQGGGLREHLLGYIADVASATMGDALDSWEGIQTARRRLVMIDLQAAGKTDGILELADEMNRELEVKNQELQGEVETLRADLLASQGKEESWRKAYEDERRGVSIATDEQELVPIEDVADAVDRAKKEYPEQLCFQLNSTSDLDSNPFEKPEEVWAALEWLGGTYFPSRTGDVSVPDFDLSLREACGWTYQAHQGETTMKKNRRWYTTKVGGRTFWLHEHMGTGRSKDARYTIRIGFDWDKDGRRVIIGFIGQHQQTDAT